MTTQRPSVLCALESDDLAPRVVATARRLEYAAYQLHFLHVVDLPDRTVPVYPGMTATPAYSRGPMTRRFTEAGNELMERLEIDPGSAEVVSGDPAAEISARADELQPDFIVLGSRGHGPLAGAILGSVTRDLADERRWPLLVVSDTNESGRQGPVVCGITTPLEDAVLAARGAERLARRLGKSLILAHVPADEGSPAPVSAGGFAGAPGGVMPTVVLGGIGESKAGKLLDAVASRLEGGTPVRKETLSGSPAGALEALAAEEGAEVIVIGRRGLGALRSAIKGSVSLDLIRDARCPIMVVPGTAGV